MKLSVYIETSVISYLAAHPSRDVVVAGRQTISHEWWSNHRHRYDLRISALVEEELVGRGDEEAAKRRQSFVAEIPSLAISDQATELAERLLSEGVIPLGVRSTHCTSVLLPLKVRTSFSPGIFATSTTPK